jgi:outer membrane protein assembly factor BamE
MVAQLQVGMSAEEVRYIMGTPMLQDAFHDNRWDYIYMQKPGYEPRERYHLTIFFQDGRVSQIMQNQMPEAN